MAGTLVPSVSPYGIIPPCHEKNWPHPGRGQNSHGSYGYEENIHASTLSALQWRGATNKQQYLCQHTEIAYVAVKQGKSYGGSFASDHGLHLFGDNPHQNARMPPATTHLMRQVNMPSHGLPNDTIPLIAISSVAARYFIYTGVTRYSTSRYFVLAHKEINTA